MSHRPTHAENGRQGRGGVIWFGLLIFVLDQVEKTRNIRTVRADYVVAMGSLERGGPTQVGPILMVVEELDRRLLFTSPATLANIAQGSWKRNGGKKAPNMVMSTNTKKGATFLYDTGYVQIWSCSCSNQLLN